MTEKEKKDAKEILDLVEKLNQEQENQIQNILELTEKFGEKWENVKEKHPEPYNFNLVDQLGANEKNHSIILKKILNYNRENDERNFPFVQSFLKAMGILEKVKNPQIPLKEKYDIDILITDEKYAVVIENKIHYARDQDRQLEKYYKAVKRVYKNISKEHIYVMYLTRQGGEPSKKSLGDLTRKELGDNFIKINFKDDILPWLKEYVLPNCLQKEQILISGIQQYIDHLKGLCHLKSNQHKIYNIMKEYLKKELGLNKDLLALTEDDLKKLYEKQKKAQKVANLLYEIAVHVKHSLRRDFLKKLFEKLNGASETKWQTVHSVHQPTTWDMGQVNHRFFGFKYPKICKIEGKEIILSFEVHKHTWFLCGILTGRGDFQKIIIEKFKNKNIEMGDFHDWTVLLFRKYDEYQGLATSFHHADIDNPWNPLFIQKMDILVDHFFERIEKVRKAWDAICEEEKEKNEK